MSGGSMMQSLTERRVNRAKRGVAIWLMTVAVLVGCTAPENEGGTAIPGAQSGAPLADEAISPSDQEAEIDE